MLHLTNNFEYVIERQQRSKRHKISFKYYLVLTFIQRFIIKKMFKKKKKT